jgi:hypothetical protein
MNLKQMFAIAKRLLWPEDVMPDLTRRRFLGALAAIPVAGALGEELAELLKPRSIISLPSTEQVWAVNQLGGIFYSQQLSKVLRQSVQPLVRFRPSRLTWDVYGA